MGISLNDCKIFQDRYTDDIFFTGDSPNCIGGWFPDMVKSHARFDRWFKKHAKKCDICGNNMPQRLKDCNNRKS